MSPRIAGIDIFCGAGGLTSGLRSSGIDVIAGFDIDPTCRYPFEHNNNARFFETDIAKLDGKDLGPLFPGGAIRLLAGCAPCQPFSPYRRGEDTTSDVKWGLLYEFARIIEELEPELVTMENVPGLASRPVFKDFVAALKRGGYQVVWGSLRCASFGIPQARRRLVLLASRLGTIRLPKSMFPPGHFRTVRDAIAGLPPVRAGMRDGADPLHYARSLSGINILRMKASRPGGTWKDWPPELRSPCHQRKSGASYHNVYARMCWDEPAPTITTQSFNFGTGRFGHPEQDRSITLREAAVLQSFPETYRFVAPGEPVFFTRVGRLIGNAVPPLLGYAIGRAFAESMERTEENTHAGRVK